MSQRPRAAAGLPPRAIVAMSLDIPTTRATPSATYLHCNISPSEDLWVKVSRLALQKAKARLDRERVLPRPGTTRRPPKPQVRSSPRLDRPLARLDRSTKHDRWCPSTRLFISWENLRGKPRRSSENALTTFLVCDGPVGRLSFSTSRFENRVDLSGLLWRPGCWHVNHSKRNRMCMASQAFFAGEPVYVFRDCLQAALSERHQVGAA
jgi:hypothetical protein